jgi:hypothetical protein
MCQGPLRCSDQAWRQRPKAAAMRDAARLQPDREFPADSLQMQAAVPTRLTHWLSSRRKAEIQRLR